MGGKMRAIVFNASHVIDAWTEVVIKNNLEFKIDYIRVANGVVLTITDNGISVYDADDLEVEGGTIVFKNITTREEK